MDSPQDTRDQTAADTMGFSEWIVVEDGQQIIKIFLRCTQYNSHRLSSKGRTFNDEYYADSMGRFNEGLKKEFTITMQWYDTE